MINGTKERSLSRKWLREPPYSIDRFWNLASGSKGQALDRSVMSVALLPLGLRPSLLALLLIRLFEGHLLPLFHEC